MVQRWIRENAATARTKKKPPRCWNTGTARRIRMNEHLKIRLHFTVKCAVNQGGIFVKTVLSNQKAEPSAIDERVREVLLTLGVPDVLLGHRYLLSAVILGYRDQDAVNSITGYLYPTIARQYNVSGSSVERTIRYAIDVAFDRGDPEELAKYFGNTISPRKGSPTNREFIYRICSVLRLSDERRANNG